MNHFTGKSGFKPGAVVQLRPRIEQNWRINLVATHPRIVDPELQIYVRDGWHKIVREMMEDLEHVRQSEPTATNWRLVTIKEKFGKLIVTISPRDKASEIVRRVVLSTRYSASRICDICGEIGVLKWGDGALRVRCDNHVNETYLAAWGQLDLAEREIAEARRNGTEPAYTIEYGGRDPKDVDYIRHGRKSRLDWWRDRLGSKY